MTNSLQSLRGLLLLGFGSGLFAYSVAAGPLVAETMHQDGRNTPALHVPATPGPLAPVSQAVATAYLRAEHARFGLPADLSNLELVTTRESLLGTHYRYRQVHFGVPVEGASVIVSLDRDGRVYHVFNDAQPLDRLPAVHAVKLNGEQALDLAWNHLRVHGALRATPRAELVYAKQGKTFRPAYKTTIVTRAPEGAWIQRIDALSGAVLDVRDVRIREGKSAASVPDFAAYTGPVASRTTLTAEWLALESQLQAQSSGLKNVVNGSALVFDPDPRTATTNAALLDTSPAASFSNAYVQRTLLDISETNGVYSLEGPWVAIAELEAPTNAPSTTTNGQWTALRGSNAFNDVMSYFHIDANQRYLQSLGFTGATGVQYGRILVDSDGFDGTDNSYYNPLNNTLAFGHGGVDDNEDADVILHEYGHALTQDIVPDWGGGDSGAIGEGFGDYWGGSYSLTASNGATFHPEWAFSWDGHGADTWAGRFMDMTNLMYDVSHTYTDHESISNIANYSDQLWSTPVFQSLLHLRTLGVPREQVDRIMIEAFFHVTGSPRMRYMAAAIVLVASQLYPAGPHAAVFYEKFTNQLILTALPLTDPTLLRPGRGDFYRTGDVVRVRWNRNGALPQAAAALAYRNGPEPFQSLEDAMESGSNGWTRSHVGGSLDWEQVTTSSHSPTHAWFAGDEGSANDQHLVSPTFTLTTNEWLSFWHRYDLESGYDGGIVELSTNGGASWIDVGSNATQNGYTTTVDSDGAFGIRRAFTGNSGTFIQTLIPLTNYTGTNVVLRFRESDDSSYGATGWWVDDVRIGGIPVWTDLAVTATNVSEIFWTLPGLASTSYHVRVKQTGSNCTDSTWVEGLAFSVSGDTDGDGLPDAWEIATAGSLTNATWNGDADGDGFSDGNEYLAGTSPVLASSLLKATAVSNAAASGWTVTWPSVTNHDYSVARVTNAFGSYVIIATNLLATPPQNTYTDPDVLSVGSRFYRIQSP